jgi:PAS domain S-box-containing protein
MVEKAQIRGGETPAPPLDPLVLLNAIPDTVVVTDAKGRILFANPAVQKFFGYSRDQLIGQDVEILVPPKDHSVHIAHRAAYMANPTARPMGAGLDLHAVRSNGTEFPVDVSLGFANTESGRMVIATIHDLTEDKRRERMKLEFIATVSHELRTPLTSIMGPLALVVGGRAGALPSSAAHLLEIASKNCQRLATILNDILDFAKIGSGEMVFDVKPIDVSSLVEQQIGAIRGFAEQYEVRVRFDPGDAHGTVQADADRLAQVVNNLISNAIKFSPRGAEVVIKLENRNGIVRILVHDHGPGIPDEFKDRIFEKFFQIEATDARQKGGVGLGLSIVKDIVGRLHGEVGFENTPDGGTTFYVALPRYSRQQGH